MVFAHPFLPEQIPGRRFKAMGHARIRHDQKVFAFDDRGRHISRAFGRAPCNMGLRHVFMTVRFDRKDVVVRKAAGDVDQTGFSTINGRSHILLGRTINDPMQLAAVRIIARDGFVAGQNHLGPAVRFANQRNAIAARAVFARSFPQRAAGLARQRCDVRIPVVITVHNDFVLEQNR